MASHEVQTAATNTDEFLKSDEGFAIQNQLKEYVYEVEISTTEIPNGYQIDNEKLDVLEEKHKDLETKLRELKLPPDMEISIESSF